MATRSSLSHLIGDLAVFRNLKPVDPAIPGYDEVWADMGMPGPERPRKQDPDFARALVWFLHRARALRGARAELSELVYLGDTALADASAFRNLRSAGGWRGWAFIGAEQGGSPHVDITGGVYSANRWAALAGFAVWLLEQGGQLNEGTALILDIDKTALGARGRNDCAVDRARVAAIQATIAGTLGEAFDESAFRSAYAALNVPRYHAFTADNQDYVAYTCLMASAGHIALDTLLARVDTGSLRSFYEFIGEVDRRGASLPRGGLRAIHDDIYAKVQAGDPTPFKAFRRREYVETADRMGSLPDDAPNGQRLTDEICLTREVVDFAGWLRDRGCLLMAVSDKPDEASLPTPELASRGYLPIHRTPTHVVGEPIRECLPER
jgi:hypothetical protein